MSQQVSYAKTWQNKDDKLGGVYVVVAALHLGGGVPLVMICAWPPLVKRITSILGLGVEI